MGGSLGHLRFSDPRRSLHQDGLLTVEGNKDTRGDLSVADIAILGIFVFDRFNRLKYIRMECFHSVKVNTSKPALVWEVRALGAKW